MRLIFGLSTIALVHSAGIWSIEIEQFPYAGFGEHFLRMYFGNPAQLRTLAVSTSSAFTALPCEGCTDCGARGSNLYNSSKSSGFSLISCDKCSQGGPCFKNRCAVGKSIRDLSAWNGYEVSDFAFHGGGSDPSSAIEGTDSAKMFGFPLRFVCQTRTRGFFNNVMDGVIGLSPASTSFLTQMHLSGKLDHPRFSLCFNGVKYSGSGKGSGVLTFGGFKQAFIETEMVYAKKLDGDNYKVNIKKIHLRVGGGLSVRATDQLTFHINPPTGIDTSAVVDSVTRFLTFDKRFEEPFRTAWREATGQEFTEARQDLTPKELATMPTMLIELEGDQKSPRELDPSTVPGLTNEYNVLIAVPSIHYMEKIASDFRPFRARIHFEGQQGSYLGLNIMQGHTVSYEPDLNRIGFAESRLCQPGGGDDDSSGVGHSGGNQTSEQGGTANSETGGGSSAGTVFPSQRVETDDMFVSGAESTQSGGTSDDETSSGGCYTATCRSFMAVGYVFIGTALAVVYRLSRPKERAITDVGAYTEVSQTRYHQEDLSPVYRRKTAWNEIDGPTLI